MMRQTSTKTKFGWASAFEQEGKIVRIKFGKKLLDFERN
tara:strand:+ start:280 stop:396 length:117 start_codon:yes stop_codon:yes gene_type:complete